MNTDRNITHLQVRRAACLSLYIPFLFSPFLRGGSERSQVSIMGPDPSPFPFPAACVCRGTPCLHPLLFWNRGTVCVGGILTIKNKGSPGDACSGPCVSSRSLDNIIFLSVMRAQESSLVKSRRAWQMNGPQDGLSCWHCPFNLMEDFNHSSLGLSCSPSISRQHSEQGFPVLISLIHPCDLISSRIYTQFFHRSADPVM